MTYHRLPVFEAKRIIESERLERQQYMLEAACLRNAEILRRAQGRILNG